MASFSVLCIARETPSVLQTFIRHYEALGAERIHIYFDGDTSAVRHLATGRTEIVECLDDYWKELLGDAWQHLNMKQIKTHAICLERCTSDWLLILDADELLVSPRAPLTEMLDRVPDNVDVLRIPNVEAVWGPRDDFGKEFGCTYFRRIVALPPLRALKWPVYGRQVARFIDRGVAGHHEGKQLVRTGRHYDKIKVHFTIRDGSQIGVWFDKAVRGNGVYVAHFDAVSVDRWVEKFRRRYSGEADARVRGPRTAQMEKVRETVAQSQDAAVAYCRSLYQLSPLQYAVLRAFGLAFRARVVP